MTSDPLTRRSFIKTATIGAFGAFILQQKILAAENGPLPRQITIFGIVDVAQTLADGNVNPNVYWFDNNIILGSVHVGTNRLTTKVPKGSIVNWLVSGLEVETSFAISDIRGSVVSLANPSLDVYSPYSAWKGQIPTSASGSYTYAVDLVLEDLVFRMENTLSIEIV